MGKRKLDSSVKKKLANNVSNNDRSVIAVVGPLAHLSIPSIYSRMSKLKNKLSMSILWLCSDVPSYYESDKRKVVKLQKKLKADQDNCSEEDLFTILLDRVPINFIHYRDDSPLINQAFDLLVIQDFGSLTANQLASACECIRAGGCIIFLLDTIKDLKELYNLKMNAYKIYDSSSHKTISLFNERFLLSLMSCPTFMAIGDNLKLIPLSNYAEPKISVEEVSEDENELNVLKNSTADTQPLGCLLNCCKTLDQAKAVVKMVDVISKKERQVTCFMGPRGRGKSAALGLGVIGAVALNFSNIYITTNNLEGLQIIFHYILMGLQEAGYKEGEDYLIIRTSKSSLLSSFSSSPPTILPSSENEKIITRINVFRTCRQFIQYISPYDASRDELFTKSTQLLIIDEAASIPFDQVKSLIGTFIVFLSITNNGYKASGRSHVSNLMKDLRRLSSNPLEEFTLSDPVLFSKKDSVEKWLNKSLCLDWVNSEKDDKDNFGCPAPEECQLFYINRETLFSYHKLPETLLQKLMNIYFASDYTANANAIQLMADSPDHHLFVLLPPTAHKSKVPEVLCFIFLRLENEDSPLNWAQDNFNADGDSSISKLIQQEYLSSKLMSLHGARIIKIAINPKYDLQEYGYDRRALQLVEEYFKGNFNIKLMNEEVTPIEKVFEKIGLNLEITPRSDCEPLFLKLEERKAEVLDYIVVNIGLTGNILKFWRRNGYTPIYVNPEANEVTREHDCILIKSLITEDRDDEMDVDGTIAEKENPNAWLINLWEQFRKRFISLLSCSFNQLKALLAVEVLQENEFISKNIKRQPLTKMELEIYMTLHDLKRLEIYSTFRDDYRRITDLLPHLARFFFMRKFDESVHLSPAQLIILLGVGLQGKTIDEIGDEIGLPGNQILAHFLKSVKKFSNWLNSIQEKAISEALGLEKQSYEAIYSMRPVPGALDDELEDASEQIKEEEQANRAKLTQEMKHLAKYAIKGTEDEWDTVLKGKHKSIVSIKTVQPKKQKNEITPLDKPEKRKQKFKKKQFNKE
ncbi:RNA cytidine acetyltransferase [Tetranychus urticae]|uniref:RNA cytidine acetyltransferase n=1 Tax=Tetranychus urticae TaxID=32264 RepID=T1JSQ3_TETUR|nr:RNA cytidine acetyltransferase [Tetranychus urticae]